MTNDKITTESFRIIDAEVGAHSFGVEEWPIVRRMIHAAGDLELVRAVCFRQDAVRAGIAALRAGSPIVTDVRMAAVGINRQSLKALNVALHCFIDDPEAARRAKESGRTRSACAMMKAITEVGDAVYVVGNAPTALRALNAAVRNKTVRPRLLAALPVGFVDAVESKEEALTLDVPTITVRGRKGGSALAAAAVNALLLLARNDLP